MTSRFCPHCGARLPSFVPASQVYRGEYSGDNLLRFDTELCKSQWMQEWKIRMEKARAHTPGAVSV